MHTHKHKTQTSVGSSFTHITLMLSNGKCNRQIFSVQHRTIHGSTKSMDSMRHGWMDGVEFNAPLDTVQVILGAVFTANHLTDTDKQNTTGKYR